MHRRIKKTSLPLAGARTGPRGPGGTEANAKFSASFSPTLRRKALELPAHGMKYIIGVYDILIWPS